jgi:hypothetical protein
MAEDGEHHRRSRDMKQQDGGSGREADDQKQKRQKQHKRRREHIAPTERGQVHNLIPDSSRQLAGAIQSSQMNTHSISTDASEL